MLKMLRKYMSNKKLLKNLRRNALESNYQVSRIESCRWIPKECCVWMVDRENGCYHTECCYNYSFDNSRRGAFCTYCGKLIAVPCIEKDGECLSFSN